MASQLHASETIRAESALVSERMDAGGSGIDAERKLYQAYGSEETPSMATAALFIGLLIGAVSTASMIWIAVSIL